MRLRPHAHCPTVRRRRVVDALELLSIFSLVDAPAFLSMMREYCTGIAGDSIKSDWRNFPDDEDFKGLLGVEVRLEDAFLGDANSSKCMERVLAILLTPVPLSQRTRRFRSARKELLERVASEQERKTLENGFTVPVEIVFFLSPHRAATATFETLISLKSQILDVLAESSTRMEEARRAAMRVFPFRLANVTIGANDETLSPAFMTTVHSHVMSGVITVGDVVLRSSDGERLGDFDRQKFADFVTAVCAPNGPAVIHNAVRRSGTNVVQLEASIGLTPFVQFCVKPLYEKLHNSWIPGSTPRTVFPLRSKCVEKMNDPNETSSNHAAATSIAQLDSRILSLIFEMAGTPRRRTVILLPSY